MKRIHFAALVVAGLLLSGLLGSSHAQSTLSTRLYGIYAGEVVSTQDTTQRARLLLKIPAVSATAQLWASPSAPYVDGTVGSIKLPPPASFVWVQFEGGDPSLPVWVGWKPR